MTTSSQDPFSRINAGGVDDLGFEHVTDVDAALAMFAREDRIRAALAAGRYAVPAAPELDDEE